MSGFDNRFLKNAYRCALSFGASTLGVTRAKKIDALLRFHRWLNLDNPKSLADKVSWMELNTNQSWAAKLTDKIEVRKFVSDKGLRDLLVPLCGGPWSRLDEIDYESLPEQFVLKAAHGCEMNLICRDKSKFDSSTFFRNASLWLGSDYARACIEPHYLKIPHRLYCEKYLDVPGGIIDYKIHCFNGEPLFILVCSEREHGLKLNLYDTNWKTMKGLKGSMRNDGEIDKPAMLSELLEASRKLSEDFEFVRVDLYEVEDKIFFGELTFSPAAGVFPYFTDGFVNWCGEKLIVSALEAPREA